MDKLESAQAWINKGVGITLVLQTLEVPRSTYYAYKHNRNTRDYSNVGRKISTFNYRFDGKIKNDNDIKEIIKEMKADETSQFYGYRKLAQLLKTKYKIKINKKKVYRLVKELGLLGKSTKNRKPRISRTCESTKVQKSNQLWQMDIKYSFIAGTRQTAYITSIIDIYDREIVAQSIDLSATGEVAKKVLIEGLYNRGIKDNTNGLIIRTDNGSQFVSTKFESSCLTEHVIHERIPVRSPNYNAYIESFHRLLQDECLTGKLYISLESIRKDVYDYVYRYNHVRIHSSIKYLSPHDYYLKNIS